MLDLIVSLPEPCLSFYFAALSLKRFETVKLLNSQFAPLWHLGVKSKNIIFQFSNLLQAKKECSNCWLRYLSW